MKKPKFYTRWTLKACEAAEIVAELPTFYQMKALKLIFERDSEEQVMESASACLCGFVHSSNLSYSKVLSWRCLPTIVRLSRSLRQSTTPGIAIYRLKRR